MKKLKSIFTIIMPILLGSLVGFLARDDFSYIKEIPHRINIEWYYFLIAWSIIYILLGVWAYLKRKEDNEFDLTIYYISLFINLIYTPLFFTFHLKVIAFIDILGLFVTVLIMFIKDKNKTRYLFIPYLLWLLVASVLMIDILSS